jgi:hypothetical protein
MRVEGFIDLAGPVVLAGWIADRQNLDAQFEIEILLRDKLLGSGTADIFRPDLEDAGIGDGCHGFKLFLPAVLSQWELDQLVVKVAGSNLYFHNVIGSLGRMAASPAPCEGFWIDRPDWIDQLALKHREGKLSDELSQAIVCFIRDGYYIFKGAVPERSVDSINEQIDKLWKAPPPGLMIETFEPDRLYKFIPADIQYREGQTKLLDPHAFSSLARDAMASPKIMEFIGAICDDKPKAFQSLYFYRGSEQRIHKDTAYVKVDTNPRRLLATWLALEDVKPGAGELIYNIGSNRAPHFLFGGAAAWMESFPEDHSRFLDSLDEDVLNYKQTRGSFFAGKGDVLISHGDLAQGDAPILDPNLTRKSLLTHFTAESDEPFYRRHNRHRMLTTDRCAFVSGYADIEA